MTAPPKYRPPSPLLSPPPPVCQTWTPSSLTEWTLCWLLGDVIELQHGDKALTVSQMNGCYLLQQQLKGAVQHLVTGLGSFPLQATITSVSVVMKKETCSHMISLRTTADVRSALWWTDSTSSSSELT